MKRFISTQVLLSETGPRTEELWAKIIMKHMWETYLGNLPSWTLYWQPTSGNWQASQYCQTSLKNLPLYNSCKPQHILRNKLGVEGEDKRQLRTEDLRSFFCVPLFFLWDIVNVQRHKHRQNLLYYMTDLKWMRMWGFLCCASYGVNFCIYEALAFSWITKIVSVPVLVSTLNNFLCQTSTVVSLHIVQA